MTAQIDSSIDINARSSILLGNNSYSVFIQHIRNVIKNASTTNLLFYDMTSKEVVNSTNNKYMTLFIFC